MKSKKKYCLNMSSYKYKSGFRHLLPPIILKESNNLNINIVNIVPVQNKCPCGKNCPNYKLVIELKQEIIKLIDKISQLKKINEYSIPNTIPHPKSNITPERENEKNNNNIYNQLINSFRNSSKNKFLEIKNKNSIFKNNIFNITGKIKLRPNSAKNSDLKESYDKLFNKEKIKIDTQKKEKEKEKETEIDTEIKNSNLININGFNRRINLNFFSSSSRKRSNDPLNNKKYNNNQRYDNDNNLENNSYSRKIPFYTHESFSSLRKTKVNELSSLNLHLSNSIISPAIKITPKNLFDSLKECKDKKEENNNKTENKNIID